MNPVARPWRADDDACFSCAEQRADDRVLVIDRPAATKCPSCGYFRHGLPSAAKCPECGWDPAEPAERYLLDDDKAQARLISIGLALLLWTTFSLLAITLLMRFRDGWAGSLPVVNFPGPKVWGAVLLQRSLGSYPAPLGVSGHIAVMQGLLAIWFITTPPPVKVREGMFALRRLCRWTCIPLSGAAIGMMLATSQIQWYYRDDRDRVFLMLVLLVELPCTVMLYAYLRQLAGKDAAVKLGLTWVLIGATALISAAAVALLKVPVWSPKPGETDFVIAMIVYGSSALALALVAYSCIAKLAMTYGWRGFGPWLKPARREAGQVAALLRQVLAMARAHGATAVVAVGVVMWLMQWGDQLQVTHYLSRRAAMLGDLPFFGFLGPKVPGTFLATEAAFIGSRYDYRGSNTGPLWIAMTTLLVYWAMTMPTAQTRRSWLRVAARWLPTLAYGGVLLMVAAHGDIHDDARRQLSQKSKFMLAAMTSVELPATVLLYVYLATLARRLNAPAVARGLLIAGGLAGWTTLIAIGVGVSTDIIGRTWLDWRDTPGWLFAAGAVGALTIGSGLYAAWQVLRLLFVLCRPMLDAITRPQTPSPADA